MRPSKNQNNMDVALTIAKRSHDTETKVGAVLINNVSGVIVSTGFNGFVRGVLDSTLPNTRPDKYEYILHAENNLISNCARHGTSMNDCTLVSTLSPCKSCTRQLVNCGVTKVIALDLYKDWDDVLNMKDIKVEMEQGEDGFYYITYKV